MINHLKVVVVLPAYNAAKTLKTTFDEIPHDLVDEIILCDDHSTDDTVELAKNLGIRHILFHETNKGYGGNQKTLYQKAIELESDIVIMLHPDYQYTPKLIPVLAQMIASGLYPAVLASRILGMGALKGGMPRYKYVANRFLTLIQNLLLFQKLSEYHSGYRAFSIDLLKSINFEANSDDFLFDNQMIAQIFYKGYEIGEVTCPTKYFEDASSINFRRSVRYGIGVMLTSLSYRLNKWGLLKSAIFRSKA